LRRFYDPTPSEGGAGIAPYRESQISIFPWQELLFLSMAVFGIVAPNISVHQRHAAGFG
jgi:hypothetical protein